MNRIHHILAVTLSLSFLLAPHAGYPHDEFGHNRVSFSGTLSSSDSYSLEMAYHCMFCNYVGAGGALGYWSNYYEDGWASGHEWNISDDDNRPANLYLRPSLVLKSPAVKIRDSRLSLFAEPGVMLNIPYQRVCIETTHYWPAIDYTYISTTGGQWLALDLRLGFNLDVGPCGIALGYFMSNLDIYSQYRHLSFRGTSFNDFYPEKPFMQGAWLALSYRF